MMKTQDSLWAEIPMVVYLIEETETTLEDLSRRETSSVEKQVVDLNLKRISLGEMWVEIAILKEIAMAAVTPTAAETAMEVETHTAAETATVAEIHATTMVVAKETTDHRRIQEAISIRGT